MDKTKAVREAFAMRRYKARLLRNELASREGLERTTDQIIEYAGWAASLDRGFVVSYEEADQLSRLVRQLAVINCALLTVRCWKTLVADLLTGGSESWKCDGWQAPLP